LSERNTKKPNITPYNIRRENVNKMKTLPKIISKEIFLKIDYLMCRFMNNKHAYKINQKQSGTWFTIKKIKEEGLHEQYQIHIRFNGKDHWFKDEDTIDFDVYIPCDELKKIVDLYTETKVYKKTHMGVHWQE